MLVAVTREVSPALADCELSHLERAPIDPARAAEQHREYERCLASLGCDVHRLPADPELPDSVFVEDAAVVFDEVAVITRPGVASRRPETETVAEAVAPYRSRAWLEEPATLDGGDVLVDGRNVWVGRSARTNDSGIQALRGVLDPHGYRVRAVRVDRCLHLKSAVTRVADGLLLVQPDWIDVKAFDGTRSIDVDPSEPFAANALAIGKTVVLPAAFPRTRKRLEAEGLPVVTVDTAELAKAEGGVTCCSLVFSATVYPEERLPR